MISKRGVYINRIGAVKNRQPLLLVLLLISVPLSYGLIDSPTPATIIDLDNPDLNILNRSVLSSINKFRSGHSLKPLIWSDTLARASKFHLDNMIKRKFFDHEDPSDNNYPDLQKRLAKFSGRFQCYSENLVQYYPFRFKGNRIEYFTIAICLSVLCFKVEEYCNKKEEEHVYRQICCITKCGVYT